MDDVSALKTEIERLKLREREVERLLSLTTHNLREPVRHVLSYTQLLQNEHAAALNAEALSYLGNIEAGGRRLDAILNGLSSVSSLDSRTPNLQAISLRRVIDGARLQVAKQVQASGASIQLSDAMPAVLADSGLASDAVQHLLDNSLKFRSAAAPVIVIHSELEGAQVTVTVSDNGIGIQEAYREKCFELFKRLHSQTEYPGEGVGLAFARKAIEKMGGKIWIDAHPGQGTLIRFTLLAA